eukprot:gene5895-4233_t
MVLDDNQKIGVGLICLGLGFTFLGVILFLDASLIAIGNVLFLLGLTFSIGWKRTLNLFTRSDRMALETFGFLNLFGNFLPTVLVVGRQIPFLSTVLDHPVVAPTVDYIAGKVKPKYSV